MSGAVADSAAKPAHPMSMQPKPGRLRLQHLDASDRLARAIVETAGTHLCRTETAAMFGAGTAFPRHRKSSLLELRAPGGKSSLLDLRTPGGEIG
jgi:hypothetical protein